MSENVLNLDKGDEINLSKTAPFVQQFYAGFGWDKIQPAIDGDLFGILLRNGKWNGDSKDIVYFGYQTHASGILHVSKDNLTGEGEGDDEFMLVDLSKAEPDVTGVVLGMNIYQAEQRRQKFGLLKNSFLRLVKGQEANGEQVANFRFDPSVAAPNATGVEYVRFTKKEDGTWDFTASGQPRNGDLNAIAATYK